MGFFGRVRKSIFSSKKKGAPSSKKIPPTSSAPNKKVLSLPPQKVAPVPSTVPASAQDEGEWSQSEIDVDNFKIEGDLQHIGVWDGSHFDFKGTGGCDHSLSYVPTSISFEFDNVSLMSLMGSPSVIGRETREAAEAAEEASKRAQPQNSTSSIIVSRTDDNEKEDEGATTIEVVLPENNDDTRQPDEVEAPGSQLSQHRRHDQRDCSDPPVSEMLASIKKQERIQSNAHSHTPYVNRQTPKRRNQLLKYQQSSTKAEQLKQQISGYFRYVPRGTEGNDTSVISC